MEAMRLAGVWQDAQDRARPPAFLVTTPAAAKNARTALGCADYSYGFVLDALVPVLERIGAWRLVAHPESGLVHAAARAAAEGYRPLQLAVAPVHQVYLTPAVPTLIFPFWEFPRIPDRDFGHDTRQNWARRAGCAAAILTACRFTADAFRQAGVRCPLPVVPVPLDPAEFRIDPWDPDRGATLRCRHVVWSGEPAAGVDAGRIEPPRQGVRRLEHALRVRYREHVRPWLSDQALDTVSQWKRRVMGRLDPTPPRVPEGDLRLEGLVYTSVFNLGDLRKNPQDMLSAFLLAFQDRADVTLVLKLASNPRTEWAEVQGVQALMDELGIPFRCRVVAITEYLSEAQVRALYAASTYYVNTSRAEGACLPLQRALAAGRPAIAPRHTAMADYMDGEVGFVVESHPEPTHWPHDPERRCETTWHRLVWSNLKEQYLRSAQVAEHGRPTYLRMAAAGRARMERTASREVAEAALRRVVRELGGAPHGALSWDAQSARAR